MRKHVTYYEKSHSWLNYSFLTVGLLIVLFLSMFEFSVRAQQVTAKGDFKVWAVPAEQKVRPKDKPETSNLIWSG